MPGELLLIVDLNKLLSARVRVRNVKLKRYKGGRVILVSVSVRVWGGIETFDTHGIKGHEKKKKILSQTTITVSSLGK